MLRFQSCCFVHHIKNNVLVYESVSRYQSFRLLNNSTLSFNGLEIENDSSVVHSENLHGLSQKIVAVESVLFVANQFCQLRPLFVRHCGDNEAVNIYFSEVNEYSF